MQPSTGHFKDSYNVFEVLGKGSFAMVYKCQNIKSNETYAVKVVDKSKAGPKDVADATHEITMMARVGYHRNLVRLIEYFNTEAHLYIVMDLLDGGMLFDRIIKLKHYSEKSAVEVMRNVMSALAHIHAAGVVHRDLKPENLLLPHNPTHELGEVTDVCIADFGLSTVGLSSVCCGSPSYIAPEVILRGYYKTSREPYNEKCDIWSVGVITYALLSGRLPFYGRSIEIIFQLVVGNKWAFQGAAWANVSSEAKQFIKRCLDPNPATRPSAKELLQDTWLSTPTHLVNSFASDTHLHETVDHMKDLCERRVKAAVKVFALATNWLDIPTNDLPPFMKYIQQDGGPFSTSFTHKSQTDGSVLHHMNIRLALLEERQKVPGWQVQNCCTCTSESVCRHLQNLHEYLFVGKRSMDIQPYAEVLIASCDELLGEAAARPTDSGVLQKLVQVAWAIESASEFSRQLALCPPESLKANFMVTGAKLSEKNDRIGRWAGRKRVEWQRRLDASHQSGGSQAEAKPRHKAAPFYVPSTDEQEEADRRFTSIDPPPPPRQQADTDSAKRDKKKKKDKKPEKSCVIQ